MRVSRAVLSRVATSQRLERTVSIFPGVEAQAWRAASRYVAGRTRHEALARIADPLAAGHRVSIDVFGEQVRGHAEADQVLADYLDLVTALPSGPAREWLSVDLSHLALGLAIGAGPEAAADRLAKVAAALPPGSRVQVGAEEAARAGAVLSCVLDVAGRGLADRVGATVQANLHRSADDASALAAAGVHVRLVKGAYLEASGAHLHGEPTDIAFLRLAHLLREAGAIWSMATQRRPDYVRRCCWPWGRCRWSSCWACAPTSSTNYDDATYPPGSTFPTDPTGSGTGSGGSPRHAAV